MSEYSGYDLTHYLDFHYSAFENKKEFLRFLRSTRTVGFLNAIIAYL